MLPLGYISSNRARQLLLKIGAHKTSSAPPVARKIAIPRWGLEVNFGQEIAERSLTASLPETFNGKHSHRSFRCP